jgi:hypothetical protein
LFYKPLQRRWKRKASSSVQDPTSADDPTEELAEDPPTEEDAPKEATIAGVEDLFEENFEIQDILPTTTKAKKLIILSVMFVFSHVQPLVGFIWN